MRGGQGKRRTTALCPSGIFFLQTRFFVPCSYLILFPEPLHRLYSLSLSINRRSTSAATRTDQRTRSTGVTMLREARTKAKEGDGNPLFSFPPSLPFSPLSFLPLFLLCTAPYPPSTLTRTQRALNARDAFRRACGCGGPYPARRPGRRAVPSGRDASAGGAL